MKIDKLRNLLEEFGTAVKFEQELKKKNWFNIGGKSKVFFKSCSNFTFSPNSFNKFLSSLIFIRLFPEDSSSN